MFYLAAAFILMWVAVTGYVFFMSRRQRALEEELQTLEEMIDEKRGRA
ncbi:MAG: CcmD family protein [Caldilineaceae bacterium]|nr:CcmD family protein [Caldilineaceae bacterium]